MESLQERQLTQQASPTNGVELPRISIVVPNYNGGATLAATLNSLIEQNYPNLEIIVVDGGSTDNSVEVIRQFEPYIRWWVSEKDSGQSNAINKGFAQCTGEIVNWLCSDDLLPPGALKTVGEFFAKSPETDVLVGQGKIVFTGENASEPLKGASVWMERISKVFGLGRRSIIYPSDNTRSYIKAPTLQHLAVMPADNPIAQPSCFYRRNLLNRAQPIDESYHYAMDTELWNYFRSQGAQWQCIDQVLSISVQDGQNKTSTGGYKVILELERLYNAYSQELIPLTFWHRRLRYPLERALNNSPNKLWFRLTGMLWLMITLLLAPFYGLNKVWAMRWRRWA